MVGNFCGVQIFVDCSAYPQKLLNFSYRIAQNFGREETLANLAKRTSFANILPSQIPDSLK